MGVAPVGSTLDWSGGVTTITYLQGQPDFALCFPDEYERGTWSVTDGRAEFSFSALAADGSVGSGSGRTTGGATAK